MPEGSQPARTASFVERLLAPGCLPASGGPGRAPRDAHLLGAAGRGLCLQDQEAREPGLRRLLHARIAPLLLRGGTAAQPPHRAGAVSRGRSGHRDAGSPRDGRQGRGVRARGEDAALPAGGAPRPRGEGGRAHRGAGGGVRALGRALPRRSGAGGRRGALRRARGDPRRGRGQFRAARAPGRARGHARSAPGARLVDPAGSSTASSPSSRAASTTASCANATATCTWATSRSSRAAPWPSTPSSSTRRSAGWT